MKSIYLAIPYYHEKEEIREFRYKVATLIASYLMANGYRVFSPITHSHVINKYLPARCKNWDFYKQQDFPQVLHADEVFVVCLPGWRVSTGVTDELKLCQFAGKNVEYLTGIEDYLQKIKEELDLEDNDIPEYIETY